MEEARRVLARLERIEALDREQACPDVLLAELWALLAEAEAWVRVERHVSDAAAHAVQACRKLLESSGRTLVA